MHVAPRDLLTRMNLTDQERNLYRHHRQNIDTGQSVRNPNGSISTMLQRVIDSGGGPGHAPVYRSIPSVWNGQILNERQSRAAAAAGGLDQWPAYATPDQADARYFLMHNVMADDVGGE